MRREAGQMKERDDRWMKAWIDSCARILASAHATGPAHLQVCVCVSVCLCVCVCVSVCLSLCLSVCVGEALLLAFLDIFEVSFQDAIVILVQKIETEALAAMQVRLKPLLPYSR